MRIIHVVGARPNFMKVAPVFSELRENPSLRQILIHTGQHYDVNMSEIFFRELQLPAPDVNLGVGSGTHARQTAAIMVGLETILQERKPDLLVVYGDVNSTLAAALVCSKLGVRVAHVEAGLRSGDRTMPEEINRLVTDQVADILFTPSRDADANLIREGVDPTKIHFVGNVMIDTLCRFRTIVERSQNGSQRRPYVLITLHRPSNVDDLPWLKEILETLADFRGDLDLIFPAHPRTKKRMVEARLFGEDFGVTLCDPLPYFEFAGLMTRAKAVVTDSGGIQEETTFLGVPCLTLRENTERPITVKVGTNVLLGRNLEHLRSELQRVLTGRQKSGSLPELWDGRAASRIAKILTQ